MELSESVRIENKNNKKGQRPIKEKPKSIGKNFILFLI